MTWLIAGVALLGGGMLLVRWFVTAKPKDVLRAAKVLGLLALVALAVFLVATGRLAFALATVPAFIAWTLRFYSVVHLFRRLAHFGKAFSRASGATKPTGQTSSIDTLFLRMTLDHDSGAMDGDVADGAHKGQRLSTLTLEDLLGLLGEYRVKDTDSARVLEAYLDRHHPVWRETASAEDRHGDGRFSEGEMSVDEALKILDLAPNSGPDDIKAAHRRLMAAVHPDHGGSTYLAAKINQAKDVLLHQS